MTVVNFVLLDLGECLRARVVPSNQKYFEGFTIEDTWHHRYHHLSFCRHEIRVQTTSCNERIKKVEILESWSCVEKLLYIVYGYWFMKSSGAVESGFS